MTTTAAPGPPPTPWALVVLLVGGLGLASLVPEPSHDTLGIALILLLAGLFSEMF